MAPRSECGSDACAATGCYYIGALCSVIVLAQPRPYPWDVALVDTVMRDLWSGTLTRFCVRHRSVHWQPGVLLNLAAFCRLVRNPYDIAKRYFRSWFLVDLAASTCFVPSRHATTPYSPASFTLRGVPVETAFASCCEYLSCFPRMLIFGHIDGRCSWR